MKPAICVSELRKSYGTNQVLKGVSFDILPGEIIWHSGCQRRRKNNDAGMYRGIPAVRKRPDPDGGEDGRTAAVGFAACLYTAHGGGPSV